MLFSSFFPPLFSEKCENLLCIEHYNINTFATINVSLLSDVVLVLYPTLYIKRNTFTVLKYIVQWKTNASSNNYKNTKYSTFYLIFKTKKNLEENLFDPEFIWKISDSLFWE